MLDAVRQPLGETGWWIWPAFTVRSAGFPLSDLDAAVVTEGEGLTGAVELAFGDRVVSALRWQNPDAIDQVLAPLAQRVRAGAPSTKKDRRRERTLASYLQRYHTRNETVGFFGPIAWGRFTCDGGPTAVRAGEELTDDQVVWFEDWAVARLAAEFARDPEIRRNLRPLRAPGSRRMGRFAFTLDGARQCLDEAAGPVLDLCDGVRTATDVVEARGGGGRGTAAVLEALAESGLVLWGFPTPVHHHTERDLRRQLDALPRGPAVHSARAVLDELVAARDRVVQAAGAEELAAALAKADDRFCASTTERPRRTAEQAERGRTLLVGQHRRNVDVVLGSAVRDALAAPLDLVLRSARWFTWQVGEVAIGHLRSLHAELAPLHGAAVPVDAVTLGLMKAMRDPATTSTVADELRRKWASVLQLDPNVSRVRFTSAELADDVAKEFASPVPSWFAGRHHSPDVMIAARDADAIARGDFEFVLGELHAASVTVDSVTNTWIGSTEETVLALSEAALTDGPDRFVPLYVRGMDGLTARSYPVPDTVSARYWYLSFGQRPLEREVPAHRRLDMSAMRLVDGDEGLQVVLPDGRRMPALVVLGEVVSLVNRHFEYVPPWPHAPRVTVDGLTISREAWRVPAEEFVLPANRPDVDPLGRLAAVAERHGLPRRSFWRARSGTKPVYLDLRSPLLVRLAAAALRSAEPGTTVTFTEMLPDPEQLWLADARDRRYTSELRLTVAEGPAA